MGYSAQLSDRGDLVVDDHWDDGRSAAQRWQMQWVDLAHRLGAGATPELRPSIGLGVQQGFVLTVGQARASGLAPARLRSLIRRRVWSAPRRGVIALLHTEDEVHTATVAAAAAALARPGSVISHTSAAVLHGLPMIGGDPVRPTLTLAPRHGLGSPSPVDQHRARLGPGDVSSWHGAPVTSAARTVVDIARTDRGRGLVAADAALREGLMSPGELWSMAVSCAGWPGSPSARWVAQYANGPAESPLESLTRECLLIGGLPMPQLQGWIGDGTGWRVRVDLLWPDRRVIVEADGRMKYDTGSALWREKRRQERLEQLGYRVVRLSWDEVTREPGRTVDRVRAALLRPR